MIRVSASSSSSLVLIALTTLVMFAEFVTVALCAAAASATATTTTPFTPSPFGCADAPAPYLAACHRYLERQSKKENQNQENQNQENQNQNRENENETTATETTPNTETNNSPESPTRTPKTSETPKTPKTFWEGLFVAGVSAGIGLCCVAAATNPIGWVGGAVIGGWSAGVGGFVGTGAVVAKRDICNQPELHVTPSEFIADMAVGAVTGGLGPVLGEVKELAKFAELCKTANGRIAVKALEGASTGIAAQATGDLVHNTVALGTGDNLRQVKVSNYLMSGGIGGGIGAATQGVTDRLANGASTATAATEAAAAGKTVTTATKSGVSSATSTSASSAATRGVNSRFQKAFAEARAALGPGGKFVFDGKPYNCLRAGEKLGQLAGNGASTATKSLTAADALRKAAATTVKSPAPKADVVPQDVVPQEGVRKADVVKPMTISEFNQKMGEIAMRDAKPKDGSVKFGQCGKYVRKAIQEAMGIMDVVWTLDAKDYGPSLVRNGFSKVGSVAVEKSILSQGTRALEKLLKPGDVMIFGPSTVGKHVSGHAQIVTKASDGTMKYVSDFVQNTMIPWITFDKTLITIYRK